MTGPAMNPDPGLDPAALVELGEMLSFLHDWMDSDPEVLDRSLRRFSFGVFRLDEMAREVEHYAFVFDPNHPGPREDYL